MARTMLQQWTNPGYIFGGRPNDNSDWQAQVDYQARVDELNRQNQYKSTLTALLGEPPTGEDIAKYAPYMDSPAALQAIVSRDVALRPSRGTYKSDINAMLMSKLGREATPSELNYFGKQMEQGNLDAYGLEAFVKGTEEYQTGYTKKAREELKGELGALDTEYLAKLEKPLQAKYSAQGRPGAGAFGSALITAGKDLAAQRGSYLANIGYQGAQQGLDTLKGQYQQNLNQMYQQQQAAQGLAAESRNRYYSQADYNRQLGGQQQLMALQNQYARQNQPTFLQGLLPGLIQAGATLGGAAIMGPVGAMAGNRLTAGLDRGIYNYNPRMNLY